jgi:hypothetical protein
MSAKKILVFAALFAGATLGIQAVFGEPEPSVVAAESPAPLRSAMDSIGLDGTLDAAHPSSVADRDLSAADEGATRASPVALSEDHPQGWPEDVASRYWPDEVEQQVHAHFVESACGAPYAEAEDVRLDCSSFPCIVWLEAGPFVAPPLWMLRHRLRGEQPDSPAEFVRGYVGRVCDGFFREMETRALYSVRVEDRSVVLQKIVLGLAVVPEHLYDDRAWRDPPAAAVAM